MIESREEIIKLLEEYTLKEYEVTRYIMSGEGTSLEATYAHGVVLGKFREGDELTRTVVKKGVTKKALLYEYKLNQKYIKRINKESSIQTSHCAINRDLKSIQDIIRGASDMEIRVLLYLMYAFENYSYLRKSPFCENLKELDKAYNNLMYKSSQYKKYGLIPVDRYRKMISVNPPRIYDSTIKRTFFIKNTPLNLLKIVSKMISDGLVKNFSVRLYNEPGYEGLLDCEYLTEELERGKIFDFGNLGDCSISRLYSENYEDSLWVVIDEKNITFEELCEDVEIYEDAIVTQVIHLQYEKKDFEYITHLDHEYIFYTFDEYEKRKTSVVQKGTAKTRIKSFKIDDSRIPFDYKCLVMGKEEKRNMISNGDCQFLYFVLACYFKHNQLLLEYFHKVLSQE